MLGGGGGGPMEEGRMIGEMAVKIGIPTLVDLEDLPDDATLLTVSAVGAPAARERSVKPMDYVRAIEVLEINDIQVDGIITSENGGLATLNGWFQSAVLNIPVVDAPANGRAHPLGIMGSMGLHLVEGYVSKQAAVGGNPERGNYLEAYISGPLDTAAKIIRQTAISAGGLVAVARNPVSIAYARDHAAVGAITQAIELGKLMSEVESVEDLEENLRQSMGGMKIAEGIVAETKLETTGGFDIGKVRVKAKREEYELTFWNEYMCVEKGGHRLATFPDLIATVSLETNLPLTTAEIRKGQPVVILLIPKERLILGAGMKDPTLFEEVERITRKAIVPYL